MKIENCTPLQTAKDHEKRIKSLELALQGILFVLLVRNAVMSTKNAVSVVRDVVKEVHDMNKQ